MSTSYPVLSPAHDLERIIAHLSEVVMTLAEDGTCSYVTPNAATLLGREPELVLQTRLIDHVIGEDVGFLLEPACGVPVTARVRHPYRGLLWIEVRRHPTPDGGEICVLRDVSRVRELQIELERISHDDALTGVANRATLFRAIHTELARAQRYHRPLALVAVDIDHLRHINDDHGVEAGDQVLRLVARTLEGCIRTSDFAGRLGGEEFVMLLPETDMEGAEGLAQRVCQSISGLCVRLPHGIARVTASLGVAVAEPEDDPQRLLSRAEGAVGRAKHSGRNRVALAHLRIS